jgi:hypothetical protein
MVHWGDVGYMVLAKLVDIINHFGTLWKYLLTLFSSCAFNLPQLNFRDTRRETKWFQGGPNRGSHACIFWFLSWCPPEGVTGARKSGRSSHNHVFPEYSNIIHYDIILYPIILAVHGMPMLLWQRPSSLFSLVFATQLFNPSLYVIYSMAKSCKTSKLSHTLKCDT